VIARATSLAPGLEWFEEATPPFLETERLELRSLTLDHDSALFEIFSSPEVMRFWSRPPFTHRTEAIEKIEDGDRLFQRRVGMQWGLFRRDDGRLVGVVTLFQLSLDQGRGEVGFALARDSWRQGLMREALTRLIRFCFEEMQLRRLEADADPRNEASLRVLERQGFRREGYLRQRWCVAGEVQDSVILGLLPEDWTGGEPAARS
jgi:RimJ/RimL family protein N-acetyltransferase